MDQLEIAVHQPEVGTLPQERDQRPVVADRRPRRILPGARATDWNWPDRIDPVELIGLVPREDDALFPGQRQTLERERRSGLSRPAHGSSLEPMSRTGELGIEDSNRSDHDILPSRRPGSQTSRAAEVKDETESIPCRRKTSRSRLRRLGVLAVEINDDSAVCGQLREWPDDRRGRGPYPWSDHQTR